LFSKPFWLGIALAVALFLGYVLLAGSFSW
jgi:hypothetical protein